MDFYLLLFSFFFVALIYSSVGFGGGSSYLALMALMGVHFEIMRPAALLCNIVVVMGNAIIFYKEGLIDWKKNWPFMAASVPLAFLGGYWPIKQETFLKILGITLILAAVILWFHKSVKTDKSKVKSDNAILNFGLGGAVGFLSGLVSIGGGIFLSPILHFINWDNARRISALASLFILVNSISGLIGQLSRSSQLEWKFISPLLLSVIIGGQAGSRLGAWKFDPVYIKRITALLIFVAGLNILKDHF